MSKPNRREEPDLFCRAVNFLVLQWFGLRLSRRMYVYPPSSATAVSDSERSFVQHGWRIERWIWPLTGRWSGYRWIAKRPDLI